MSVFARAMSLGAILIMLAAYTAPAKAQEQPQAVHGIIFDSEGNPLVGATVVVAGGVQGTTTDTKGKFTLKVKPSDSLTFSYLGYTSQTTKVGSRTKFNIRLEKDASTDIEEVVVIGYGQVAKKDLTGSVSTVKMNDIKDLPTLSVDNALQGRIAGADFMSTQDAAPHLRHEGDLAHSLRAFALTFHLPIERIGETERDDRRRGHEPENRRNVHFSVVFC